ncbi:MAG TPA: hypothetical protein VLC09_06120 [Polyangiaceae bacterium]|nr:hypothetical protein [Polyangiaceae bacterium]
MKHTFLFVCSGAMIVACGVDTADPGLATHERAATESHVPASESAAGGMGVGGVPGCPAEPGSPGLGGGPGGSLIIPAWIEGPQNVSVDPAESCVGEGVAITVYSLCQYGSDGVAGDCSAYDPSADISGCMPPFTLTAEEYEQFDCWPSEDGSGDTICNQSPASVLPQCASVVMMCTFPW